MPLETQVRSGLLTSAEQLSLVDRIRQGDGLAEEELVQRFSRRIRSLAVNRTRDREAARDLVQEVLMNVVSALRGGQLRDAEKLGAFIFGIARNVINNYLRSRGRQPAEEPISDDVADEGADEESEMAERMGLVRRALQRLDRTDQQILSMTLVEGCKPGEISVDARAVRRSRPRAKIARAEEGRRSGPAVAAEPIVSPSQRQHLGPAESGQRHMTCEEIEQSDVMEQYLLGRLPPAARDDFDGHLFECDECFERLETFRALRRELAATATARRAEPVRATRGWIWRWALVPTFATLVIVGVTVWPRAFPPSVPAPARPARRPRRAPRLRRARLPECRSPSSAACSHPRSNPRSFRGVQDAATARFREGMKHYRDGDYRAAIPGLRAAAQLDPEAAHATFFLGICHGLTGQLEAAIRALRQTIAVGDSPYLEEAHFYLAKALLQNNDPAGARQELARTIRLRGLLENEARKLLADAGRIAGAPALNPAASTHGSRSPVTLRLAMSRAARRVPIAMALAFVAVTASAARAQPPDPVEPLRRLIREARFPEAEDGARRLLTETEAASGPDSLQKPHKCWTRWSKRCGVEGGFEPQRRRRSPSGRSQSTKGDSAARIPPWPPA